ncbi:BCCT family transporter [Actinomyces trachealis]|uniref:BCCT family transporter n=1 Tax=Actinomyces trachealis TaxID=2763540 RepID=UPI0018929A0F|nr:BCCT family transporter [Actinomyces trachealis]
MSSEDGSSANDSGGEMDGSDPISTHTRCHDDNRIRIAAVTVVVLLALGTVLFREQAFTVIDVARTFVTEYFSWYFVVFSGLALVFVLVIALSSYGSIRLGGPRARTEYGRFAWYSMLFASGQGIGLIFWSVAEPVLLKTDDPLADSNPGDVDSASLSWGYFHWGLTAWAIYCVVALCIAYSTYNCAQQATFRGACEDLFPARHRRRAGLAIELFAILATILGLSTSFGFASLQLSSGLSALLDIEVATSGKVAVITTMGAITAISVYFGINRGMRLISELNSVLSVVLVFLTLIFGPTMYILHILPQSVGEFIDRFVAMSVYSEPKVLGSGITTWSESWNGQWTTFFWCWCIAFSPFVASFIASISKGRTLREFILGVLGIPTIIVMIWIGVIGGAALHYDTKSNGAVGNSLNADVSAGLFTALGFVPLVGGLLILVSTVLVGTYFVTSLDSGVHALSGFVSMGAKASPRFRVVLAILISILAIALLTLGGGSALTTIQTGTIVGALPFSAIILLMLVNIVRRLRRRQQHTGTDLPCGVVGAHRTQS